ncbi:MAG TPA: dTMP kinase [Candidatus Lokiarchaeia archaeon]|nr:dTMP kinase [Candidatus Lokiarchaeia archaeon]
MTDGIDGSGKSTQVSLLEKNLLENGFDVLKIAEPTKSPFGIKIREAMMNAKKRLSFEEELDLFIQDRRYNVDHNIEPALAEGKIVILDRYYFSTAAYQGARGKLAWQDIIAMNEAFAPVPDIVFFFFMPVDVALKRIDKDATESKRGSRSYMEKRGNLEKVQEIFQQIHDSGAYNSISIDATSSIDEIQSQIWNICEALLSNKSNS